MYPALPAAPQPDRSDRLRPVPSRGGTADAAPSTVRGGSIMDAISRGDRDAVAEFVFRYGLLIRMRVRDQLGVSVRRVLDSEDLLATLARRVDELVERGAVRAASSSQLWALLMGIASQAALEYARRVRVDRRRVGFAPGKWGITVPDASREVARQEDAVYASRVESTLRLTDEDRAILQMRLRGCSHGEIAAALGTGEEAVRMRWARLRQRMQTRVRGSDVEPDRSL